MKKNQGNHRDGKTIHSIHSVTKTDIPNKGCENTRSSSLKFAECACGLEQEPNHNGESEKSHTQTHTDTTIAFRGGQVFCYFMSCLGRPDKNLSSPFRQRQKNLIIILFQIINNNPFILSSNISSFDQFPQQNSSHNFSSLHTVRPFMIWPVPRESRQHVSRPRGTELD